MSKTITKSQYLQLIGLKALADKHTQALEDILEAALDITQETDHEGRLDGSGHTCDMVYSYTDGVDEALRRMGVEVTG